METVAGRIQGTGAFKGIARSIGAVVAGSIAIGITSFAADYLLAKAAPDLLAAPRDSNPALLIFMLVYSVVFSGAGGYITAALAGRSQMKHVVALAVLQFAGGLAAATQAGSLLPAWFLISVVVLPVPAIVLGGVLKSRASSSR